MLYEVYIPQPGQQPPRVERVHGDNWLDALRRGLAAAGLPAPTSNLACDLQDDDSVIITDTGINQVYRVQPAQLRASGRRISLNGVTSGASMPEPLGEVDDTPLSDPLAEPVLDHDDSDPDESMLDPMFSSSDHSEVIRPSLLTPEPTPQEDERPTIPHALPPEEDDDPAAALLTLPEMETLSPDLMATAPVMEEITFGARPEENPQQARMRALLQLDEVDAELDELRHMGRDVHDACNFTLDVILSRVQCRAGAIMLIKPRQRSFYFTAVRGSRLATFVQQMIPLSDGIPGAALRTRQPINLIDPALSPLYDRDFTASLGQPPSAILAVPIFALRKAFGMIDLIDRVGRDGFTQEDEELVALCAQRLGDHFASLLPRR